MMRMLVQTFELSAFAFGALICLSGIYWNALSTDSVKNKIPSQEKVPTRQSSAASEKIVEKPEAPMDEFELSVFEELKRSDMVAAPFLQSLEARETVDFILLLGDAVADPGLIPVMVPQ